jgi:excisionase family DNA binding protein
VRADGIARDHIGEYELPPPRLAVSQAAKHLQCSDQKIYNMIAQGKLRAIRCGNLIRIPPDALTEFEEANSTIPVPARRKNRTG